MHRLIYFRRIEAVQGFGFTNFFPQFLFLLRSFAQSSLLTTTPSVNRSAEAVRFEA